MNPLIMCWFPHKEDHIKQWDHFDEQVFSILLENFNFCGQDWISTSVCGLPESWHFIQIQQMFNLNNRHGTSSELEMSAGLLVS